MKFVELNLMNQNIELKAFEIMIFGLNKFKKVNRLILHCKKNECCNNCIDYFLNELKIIKKLQKLELNLENKVNNRIRLKIKEQFKCQIF